MSLNLSQFARLRLRNQSITAPIRGDASDVVGRLMAVQSQDYAGASWAVGMRLRTATAQQIEQAFNDGRILRTHVLRPTWHFVAPQDIRWLLKLTSPRVQQANGTMYRRAQMEPALFRRAEAVMLKSLVGHRALTRLELHRALERARIPMQAEFRFTYLLIHAELEGLICSGPRRGKQFTYMLLDDRAPQLKRFDRPLALAEFARRFFTTRGPATARDLAKWSSLTLADCRAGIDAARPQLHSRTIEGQEYFFATSAAPPLDSPTAHMLSVYDEYLSSYHPLPAISPTDVTRKMRQLGPALMGVIAIDGVIVGIWKRSLTREAARITLSPFGRLSSANQAALARAADRYAAFHGLRAEIV